MKGLGISGGVGQGRLVEWKDGQVYDSKSVVVVDILDSRVISLSHVCGIVSLAGGITSHGAVLAREFGIPCIVTVDGHDEINSIIGSYVCIDGWEGTIESIEEDKESESKNIPR